MYWMGENLVSVSNGHGDLHIIKYAGCAVNTSQGMWEYGEAIVAFDGYNDTSTKDMTHQRWAGERTAETVTFEESKPVTMKKVPQNSAKKQQLITMETYVWNIKVLKQQLGRELYMISCHKTGDEKRMMGCFPLSKLAYHPRDLLYVIRCSCKTDCSSLRCTCKNHNIKWRPVTCSNCKGSGSTNTCTMKVFVY